MTVGSLFAGIGGFDLGFERAGYDILWQVEKDPWCRRVLAKNFPNTIRRGDIYEAGSHNLPVVDVICGGFPCQPFSAAGRQAGSQDNRYLWPEMSRIISELQPTWVVAENVDTLVAGEMEPVFEFVVFDLERKGYDVQCFIIPACGVDAPHRRYRLWIIGHANNERKPVSAIHAKKSWLQNVGYTYSKGLQAWERKSSLDGSIRIPPGSGRYVAYADSGRCRRRQNDEQRQTPCYESKRSRSRYASESSGSFTFNQWQTEPSMGRVVDGFPGRVDQVRGLGNAIVPDIAEMLGHIIKEVTNASKING